MRGEIEKALAFGFAAAAIIPSRELVVVPEYRRFCAQNLCGCYGRVPACPPQSGTVEEMTARFRKYENALILQTITPDTEDAARAKARHNQMTDALLEGFTADHLVMSAGPWRDQSCMSAYCVDAQKMADTAGMLCWAHDGMNRFFSLVLF